MLGGVKTILGQLKARSTDGLADALPREEPSGGEDGGTTDKTATDGSETAVSPHLYNCHSCDRVYVATDKRTCSTCDTTVDRIEQTG